MHLLTDDRLECEMNELRAPIKSQSVLESDQPDLPSTALSVWSSSMGMGLAQ
jgi:hypothetical protein